MLACSNYSGDGGSGGYRGRQARRILSFSRFVRLRGTKREKEEFGLPGFFAFAERKKSLVDP